MVDCQRCERPINDGWIVCGWCGAGQRPAANRVGFVAWLASWLLQSYAWLILVPSMIAVVALARHAWSPDTLRVLGLVWPVVLVTLGFLAWANAAVLRVKERAPVAMLRQRRTR